MPSTRTYLDHNATSPLRPEARAAMLEAMDVGGNPSSVHAEGRQAKAVLERARRQVASLVGAKPEQVVFTSGGTEANAMALLAPLPDYLELDEGYTWFGETFDPPGRTMLLAMSSVEHDSVRATGRDQWLGKGILLHPDTNGRIDPDHVRAAIECELNKSLNALEELDWPRFLVSVMAANNEVGTIQPIAGLAEVTRNLEGAFHTDAVQLAGKMNFSFSGNGADLATISAHKFGGPKGIGAVLVADPDLLQDDPIVVGGGQENRMRAGTENLIGTAGFGAAAEAAERDLESFAGLADWRDELEGAVIRQTPDAVVIARDTARLPNTSCIALPGVRAETLVMALDLEGIAVSAGSACSSGKVTRSHVLEAMGLGDELSASAIRVSLGWNSSKKDVEMFTKAWATVTDRLASRSSAA